MIIIGVSGVIGSGKSTMLEHLNKMDGVKVIEADKISKLVLNDESIKEFLRDQISEVIENNEINRSLLRNKVFNDHELNEKFTSKMWPLISKEINNLISKLNLNYYKLVFVEAAVITGLQVKFDKTILLEKENNKRIKSVQFRDKRDHQEIESISKFQMEKIKNYKFDFILENNSNKEKFYKDIDNLINKIKK
ncbi:dephospho-CoA kinase [Spiroplasma taiwanense]|uniref:Dephospho-CoA kinase n=1 Tax=Spiroplasma taiwanense CT-1 TaxID=1276220 RepID=S5LZT3_9MOLU|nr:dephospho-CoA kinase [Spiroplasma taiwanense]AGR41217.1 dephospho-CoA kinase [Spiroplasma taiwanense CT-1]